MKILVDSYQPRVAPDGSGPDSFVFQGSTFYPYVLNFEIDGQKYQGEANVTNTPPWWEIGKEYEVTIENDAKYVGGNKIKFARMQQNHTGGSPFRGSSQTQAPQYSKPTSSAPQNQQTSYQQSGPSRDDFRQSLIVAQTSMKVAAEYVTALTEPERLALQESLKAEDDLVSKYAMKIAEETYRIAHNLNAAP